MADAYKDDPDWIWNLTARLKYSLDEETITRLVEEHGIVAPKGPRGSVLFFHGNLVHGSAPNMSPVRRAIVLITYNRLCNIPRSANPPRPEFLASRDYRPVKPLPDDCLLCEAEVPAQLEEEVPVVCAALSEG
jgi:ectoine hydroxylase